VPQGTQGDCYDRYLIRVEEMRTSIQIINQCINAITLGEIKANNIKTAPSKTTMRNFMEATIQHFK